MKDTFEKWWDIHWMGSQGRGRAAVLWDEKVRPLKEEMTRLTAENARLREALEHVESQLYIDDYGDYGLLTTFDADMVRQSTTEAERWK